MQKIPDCKEKTFSSTVTICRQCKSMTSLSIQVRVQLHIIQKMSLQENTPYVHERMSEICLNLDVSR
jgi:hypothetical protein